MTSIPNSLPMVNSTSPVPGVSPAPKSEPLPQATGSPISLDQVSINNVPKLHEQTLGSVVERARIACENPPQNLIAQADIARIEADIAIIHACQDQIAHHQEVIEANFGAMEAKAAETAKLLEQFRDPAALTSPASSDALTKEELEAKTDETIKFLEQFR